MSLVFLSHSSANNAHALALAQWLESNGWTDYFLDISDSRGLKPGSQWQNALKNASHRCEAVIFLVSRAWVASNWCVAEFLLAKQLGKKIFGVLIEDIPIGELPHELTSEWQLCDLVKGAARVTFDVEREPFVPPRRVDLPEVGLTELKHGLQGAGLEATTFPWPPENEPERAPYRGLKPFEAKDAAIFFGRDAAIARGLDQVRQLRDHGFDKLLVILGSSGAGKSSFMRAGLWPRLARDDHHFFALPVVRPARAAINGEEGLVNSLATALMDVGITTIRRGDMRARFKTEGSGDALLDYVQQLRDALVAKAVGETPEPTFILPIDQGEELYASDGAEEAAQLRTQLTCLSMRHDEPLAQREGPKLLAMVTIRTDLYAHLQSDERLRDVGRQMIDLTPMDRAEYKRIIEGPARRATEAGKALVVEPELTEQLLADTHGADALPMLAFTLERLYTDYGADGDMTLEEYRLLGGVTGSLTAAIEAAMASPQSPPIIPADKVDQQRLLRQAFIPWLAEVDEQSGERRRRVADRDELPAETHPMLERLTHARLLVRDLRRAGDAEDRREVVEVAHEALLRRWPALVDWLDADQDALKAIGSVSRAALHWAQNHQNDEYLIHAGERLRYAETLLAREDFTQRLGSTGCAYLARSRAVEDARKANETRQRRRLRGAFVIAVLLAIGASGAAGLAYLSMQEAETAQVLAERNAAEAIQEKRRADLERDEGRRTLSLMHADLSRQQTDAGFATLGVLLALEALPKSMREPDRPYVPEAKVALIAALDALRMRSIMEGHEDAVYHAAFSPDGTRVVTASGDKTARLWDVASAKEIAVLEGHDDAVTSAAFSPDGTWVVTGSADKTARLWVVASAQEVAVFKSHAGVVTGVAFSPEGTRVVTASEDRTTRLWDVASAEEVAVLEDHDGGVNSVAFSPDGTRVVTASVDKVARLWDLASAREVAVLAGHERGVYTARFNDDGTRVVTASGDNTARLWDASSAEEVAVLEGHERAVYSATFSPDGTLVMTASADKSARLWDVASAQEVAVFNGHEGDVYSVAFSSDGTRVVTASDDSTARLWDVASAEEASVIEVHGRWPVTSAAFSPDGTRVVTASGDKTARLWDVARAKELAVLEGHEEVVTDAAFSPDGTRVVTASGDDTARLWDVASGKEVAVLEGHERSLRSAAFSPDGTRVVTASVDKTARLWDVASAKEVVVLEGHGHSLNSAAFSPDGTRVVTASDDNTARVWDVASAQEVAVLEGHERSVRSAAFSPDGTRVVTASADKTARLWDVASAKLVAVLEGHGKTVNSAAFSRDGMQVMTASGDNTARLWDVASAQEVKVLRGHDGRVNSAAFSPDGTRVVTASADGTARLWDNVSTEALIDRARERVPRKELTLEEKTRFYVPGE